MRTRVFTITQFELWTEDQYHDLLATNRKIRFIAYGLETCPTTGRQHHQGWVCFHNQVTVSNKCLGNIGKIFGNAHVEPMFGSLQSNNKYCSKESELKKFGDEPKQGDRNDLKDVVKRVRDGETTADEICLEDPGYYHMYGRTIQKAEDICLRKKFRSWMTKGIWYYGNTGKGKSHQAFLDFDPDTCYVKSLTGSEYKWWDGYTGQEIVIFNEFRGEIAYGEILSLVDKWPHYVPRRNREPAPFLAKTLIVTSALHPQEVWKNRGVSDSMDQLYRRFDVGLMTDSGITWEISHKCSGGNTGNP